MITSPADWRFGTGHPGVAWSLVLVMFVWGGIGRPVQAQQPADTTQQKTQESLESAPLDTLPSGQLRPPPSPTNTSTAANDTGRVDRVFVNADSLSAVRKQGERVQELFGDVYVRQDTTRLRSSFARRYLQRDELLFIGDVVVYERGDTLRADTVRYDRVNEVGYARGNVRLTDGEVHVRANKGTYYAAEKRSVFPDSVVLVDSNRVLRARRGVYWSDQQRAEFGGGVHLSEPTTNMFSDSLTYYRDQQRSLARGHVFIERWQVERNAKSDSTARTYIFGDRVDTRQQRQYTRVDGHALLVRIRMDSTGTPSDTLIVRGRRLEAFRTDTHRRLMAIGSVRIWQPNLAAVADSVVYDRVIDTLPDSLETNTVPIDTARPPPDSIGALAKRSRPESPELRETTEDSLTKIKAYERARRRREGRSPASQRTRSRTIPDSVTRRGPSRTNGGPVQTWKTPTARSEAQLPLEEIRLFRRPITWFQNNQVWGDSIRIRVQNRTPDTVFVRGSAFAAQRDSVLDRIHQLKAQNITAFFQGDSLRRIRGAPNARVIRFLASESDSLSGAAQASGDWVVLRVLPGGGKHIKFGPGIEGTWYRTPETVPEPFRLEGFQWRPKRKPTRDRLLQEDWIRGHLNRSQPFSSPPVVKWEGGSSSAPKSSERRPFQDSLHRRRARPADSAAAWDLPTRTSNSLPSKFSPTADSIPPPRRPSRPSDTLDLESPNQP